MSKFLTLNRHFLFLFYFSSTLLFSEIRTDSISLSITLNPVTQRSFLPKNWNRVLGSMEYSNDNLPIIGVTGENAHYWNTSSAPLKFSANWQPNPHILLQSEWLLRKSFDAWAEEGGVLNFPFNFNQIDINEPSLGIFRLFYAQYSFLQLGRFPIHWSPSDLYGVTLSQSVPYHDGLTFSLGTKNFQFLFLASSLNPWLSGTPESETFQFPLGSEEYQQRKFIENYNDRNRSYDTPSKTLFAHRFHWSFSRMDLGMTEFTVIGGKSPAFRDANPLILYHNNYNDGYSNIGVGLDAKLKFPRGTFFGEIFIDDIKEADDGGKPTRLAWMLGTTLHSEVRGIRFQQSFHLIQTGPTVYQSNRPLLRLTSRQVHKSNYYSLDKSPFIDTYVFDYSLGYIGGPDRFDAHYHLKVFFSKELNLNFYSGYHQLGESQVYRLDPFLENLGTLGSPSGMGEEKFRNYVSGSYSVRRNLFLELGFGLEFIAQYEHQPTKSKTNQAYLAGISYQFDWNKN